MTARDPPLYPEAGVEWNTGIHVHVHDPCPGHSRIYLPLGAFGGRVLNFGVFTMILAFLSIRGLPHAADD